VRHGPIIDVRAFRQSFPCGDSYGKLSRIRSRQVQTGGEIFVTGISSQTRGGIRFHRALDRGFRVNLVERWFR
jgi:hypothetical protein